MHLKRVLTVVAVGSLLVLSTSAKADFCMQLSDNLSGSLGFFHFAKKLPKGSDKIIALHGARGNLNDQGPAYGTAVTNSDGTCVNVGADFFADGDPGQFFVEVCVANAPAPTGIGTVLTGASTYGTTPAWSSETATIVACP